jgi:hypothetical protein
MFMLENPVLRLLVGVLQLTSRVRHLVQRRESFIFFFFSCQVNLLLTPRILCEHAVLVVHHDDHKGGGSLAKTG